MESCKASGICPPVVIYVALSVLGLLSMMSPKNKGDASPKIWQSVIYVIVMTLLLYYLCKTCHDKLAWGLLLLPFILLALMFLLFKGEFDRILKDIGKKCTCN